MASAQALDAVIQKSANYITTKVESNSNIAIVSIESGNKDLSSYVMDLLPDYVLLNKKNITLVDRSKLDVLQKEVEFQYSGEVDEKTMVKIGNILGVSAIITGRVFELNNQYGFSIKILDVETARLLASQTFKIDYDDTMKSFFPDSGINRRQLAATNAKKAKQQKATETVKTVFGIFSEGFYLGYIGSLNAPIGFSFGGISGRSVSFFWDNQFGAPSFNEKEVNDKLHYKGDSVYPDDEEYYDYGDDIYNHPEFYKYAQQKTKFTWESKIGFNAAIINPILWISLAGGIVYSKDYKLFENSNEQIWLTDEEHSDGRVEAVLSAGALLKIHHFYGQLKFKYIIGAEFESGLNMVDAGVGYIWRL